MTLKSDITQWQLAGLESPNGLDRPAPVRGWPVPAVVELQDELLVWQDVVEGREPKWAHPEPGMLETFLGLADKPDSAIVECARKWGTLHEAQYVTYYSGTELVEGTNAEDLVLWRAYALRMQAALTVASRLHRGQIASESEWIGLFSYDSSTNHIDWSEDRKFQHGAFEWWLNNLLHTSGIRLSFSWRPSEGARISYAGTGFLGALVLQLLFAVSRTDGIAHCSNCQAPYLPGRRPNPKRRNYCPTCRKRGIPLRDAQRDRRDRLRAEKESG